eukprot:scaffold7092_cov262-Pinguiococcus_pyrenoidosus.AAC.13
METRRKTLLSDIRITLLTSHPTQESPGCQPPSFPRQSSTPASLPPPFPLSKIFERLKSR